MKEEWKAFPGYEHSHEVSNLGRVRSLDRTYTVKSRWGKSMSRTVKGRVRKPYIHPRTGYVFMQITDDRKHHSIHRIVATLFVENPEGSPEVNHKNGVRHDNRAENLEWVTSSENKLHSYQQLGRKQHGLTVPIKLIDGRTEIEFPSGLAAAEFLERNPSSVMSALHKGHRCAGYSVVRGAQ